MAPLMLKRTPTVSGSINNLPSSKSISNRALIVNALSGGQSVIHNLASASDTQLMKHLLYAPEKVIDAQDAGTTMRFLTAYFAVTGQNKILTGTERMKQRPIGLLVDALQTIGAEIIYHKNIGFPPLEIKTFKDQDVHNVTLAGNISSQYISALMMVAPVLPKGLTIQIEGKIVSRPYLNMTLALMNCFGVVCTLQDGKVHIPKTIYKTTKIVVEPDWSSIGYWMAWVALAEKADITLVNVLPESIQGDRVIVDIMEQLGVETTFRNGNALLSKKDIKTSTLEYDFTDCPDLAPTVLPVCALKGIGGKFCGIEHLRIKETDRIAALQKELAKVGARLFEESGGVYRLYPAPTINPHSGVQISTYKDHRIAMGFAPWATRMPIEIEDSGVVKKSYPEYWNHLKSTGLEIQTIASS